MPLGPFGTSELLVMFASALPWLILLALGALALRALHRSARANERIADALERPGQQGAEPDRGAPRTTAESRGAGGGPRDPSKR